MLEIVVLTSRREDLTAWRLGVQVLSNDSEKVDLNFTSEEVRLYNYHVL